MRRGRSARRSSVWIHTLSLSAVLSTPSKRTSQLHFGKSRRLDAPSNEKPERPLSSIAGTQQNILRKKRRQRLSINILFFEFGTGGQVVVLIQVCGVYLQIFRNTHQAETTKTQQGTYCYASQQHKRNAGRSEAANIQTMFRRPTSVRRRKKV